MRRIQLTTEDHKVINKLCILIELFNNLFLSVHLPQEDDDGHRHHRGRGQPEVVRGREGEGVHGSGENTHGKQAVNNPIQKKNVLF